MVDAPAEPPIADRIETRAATALVGVLAAFAESAPWRPGAALLALLTVAAMARVALASAPLRSVMRRLAPSRPLLLVPPDTSDVRRRAQEALLVATLVPWITLLLVAEPGRTVRFLFLWSLLAIWLAAFFTEVMAPALRNRARWVAAPAAFAVLAALLVNPLDAHAGSWRSDGWAGPDAPEVVAADALADRIRAEGRTSAAIGYRLYIYKFFADYNVIDPEYRAGTEFDLLLRFRNGIANTNTCPEGVSGADEYRIVQTEPLAVTDAPRDYVDVAATQGFRIVQALPRYQILARD